MVGSIFGAMVLMMATKFRSSLLLRSCRAMMVGSPTFAMLTLLSGCGQGSPVTSGNPFQNALTDWYRVHPVKIAHVGTQCRSFMWAIDTITNRGDFFALAPAVAETPG
jgi:hypothetical protein